MSLSDAPPRSGRGTGASSGPPLAPAASQAGVLEADRPTTTPLIPPASIGARALLGVIAIMSFLAALTLGAVVLVRAAAFDWQSQVSREITIQVRPAPGRDLEADVERVTAIARAAPAIADVKAMSKDESVRLLEPWLGVGLSLEDLPVPRLILVTVAPGKVPDLDRLRRELAQSVPGASVDDHRGWVERMRTVTRTAAVLGLCVLALMLGATVLLVAFATEGAMAANRAIVEVLHFVGAKNHYIGGQFQRHFLLLGLKGAAIGGGVAAGIFFLARVAATHLGSFASYEGQAGLVGALALGPEGYGGIAGIVVLTAAVAALTSRWTVHRTLEALD